MVEDRVTTPLYVCHVCLTPIEPDAQGKIRYEGVSGPPPARAWVWGPVPVHDPCRLRVKTPYDDQIIGWSDGGLYAADYALVPASQTPRFPIDAE